MAILQNDYTPSDAEVARCHQQWANMPNYVEDDRVLTNLMKTFPSSTNVDEVLLKCAVIDRFYSTNILGSDINKLAHHIASIHNIDSRLQSGDLSLVDDIASCPTVSSYYLSFASKYCNWHNHRDFPIYDSIVREILWELNKMYTLGIAKKSDLSVYSVYSNALIKVATHFGLKLVLSAAATCGVDFKALDRYLWVLGKLLIQKTTKPSPNKAVLNVPKGQYVVQHKPSGSISIKYRSGGKTTTVPSGKVKATLLKIAKYAGFQYDKRWNTRQFGNNLIININDLQK